MEGVRAYDGRARSRRSRAGSRRSCELVAIEHSVFALPFAYLSALVAMDRDGTGVHWVDLLLITVAMVAGRTFAMAANRILDRHDRRAEPAYRATGSWSPAR